MKPRKGDAILHYTDYMKLSEGIITAVSGGLYEIRCDDGAIRRCPARGVFRHENITPLVGDRVTIQYDGTPDTKDETPGKCPADAIAGGLIMDVRPRRSELIRPPIANLDLLFITVAAAMPDPVPLYIDKLTCIAEHNGIVPVIIITKRDIATDAAEALAAVYRLAGYQAFTVSAVTPDDPGLGQLRSFIGELAADNISAFAGVSGVGKSTILGLVFPGFSPEVGELSRKISRGRHTTRSVTLYPAPGKGGGYIADTPGFSLLDFIKFDFMEVNDLELEFREFSPYLGKCRYTDCSHTKEEGCAVLTALADGQIAPSRHESYLKLRAELREKRPWR